MLICPKCGKKENEKEFVGPFCIDCVPVYLEVKRKVEIKQCSKCGRIKVKGEWKIPSDKDIIHLIKKASRGEFKEIIIGEEEEEFIFVFEKEGKRFERKRKITLDVKRTTCERCSRILGGYFEGIIQIRGDPKKIERTKERLIKILKRKTFIPKVERIKEGINIYVGEMKGVLEALREGKYKPEKITRKLHGMREGKRIYRTTILLRV